MYFLYSLLTAAAAVVLLPWFLWKAAREGKYRRSVGERFGRLPFALQGADARPTIWIHAVSVGEVLAGVPLARKLKELFPEHRLLVSTTTDTGQALARQRFDVADGIFYFPFDWAWVVRRMLRAVSPSVLVILETEIWPNVLRECARAGVPVVFVNGRISDRSFARYRKWLAVSGSLSAFVRDVLGNASLFLTQSQPDAARLLQLGAPEERVAVTGNLKYDLSPPLPATITRWLESEFLRQNRRPVLVAGSVVTGEEEPVLVAYDSVRRKWNRALLILAPRKPERFDDAARLVAEKGWHVVRRSALQIDAPIAEDADVLLLDSVGELAGLYRLADATFVGGSLIASGGHNILEPALYGKPPCFGPSMENFSEMAQLFLQREAALQVASGSALGDAWTRLIEDAALSERMGRAAQSLVTENAGATDRTFVRIAALLQSRGGRA